MPIVNGKYISPTWQNNSPPALEENELQDITDTLESLSASGGGSGKRYANLVIGTSTNGWAAADCDYLCDGAADDVEFNAAISKISSISTSGGSIVVLSGEYSLSSKLSFLNGISLIGSGDVTLRRNTTGTSGSQIDYMVGVQNATISNISFDGNSTLFQGSPENVYEVVAGPQSTIERCTIFDFVYGGIYVASSNYEIPARIYANNVGTSGGAGTLGIYIGTSQSVEIENNHIYVSGAMIQSSAPNNSQSTNDHFCRIINNGNWFGSTGTMILDGLSYSIVSCNRCNSIQILNTLGWASTGKGNIISENSCVPASELQACIILGSNTGNNIVSSNNLYSVAGSGTIQDNGSNNIIANNNVAT